MKYCSPFSDDSGTCRFLVVTTLAFMVLMEGCKQSPIQSTNRAGKTPKYSDETATGPSTLKSESSGNKNPITKTDASEVIKPQLDANELIQLAAGPMAESVNSGLSHLDGHLGTKDHTLRIMALKSETRRWYFLSRTVALIDEEQLRQASSLIESYDVIYQDLCDRRARILETERDRDRVRQLLKYNKVAVIMVGVQIRQRIIRDVLTPKQRKLYAAQFEQAANNAATPDTPKSPSVIDDNKSK